MRPRCSSIRTALAVLPPILGVGLAACSGGGRHSVLLVTLDTTRADALGAYGSPAGVTPALDALAAEGVVFERAYTVAPLTLPAHASMLTGLAPPRHGVRDNGIAALPRSAETLAERASAAGFQTAAFLGSVVLDAGFGLEQGFERYEAPARRFYGGRTQGYAERSAMETAGLAATWLRERDPARPFFLWVHLWDAHSPYEPTPERLERAGGNAYLGEVAANDQAVGILVNALRGQELDDSTLIIVVADHGEAFGEHGELSHGPFVWDTTLRVPLILRKPGGAGGGRRVTGIASVADVFPTALAAMDLGLDAGLDGVSLYDDEPEDGRGAYFESYYGALQFGWHPLAGWIDGGGKYVHAARERFYDPATDPGEEHELAAERGPELARYRDSIAALGRARALDRDAEGIDPELRQALQAVGYAALASEGAPIAAPLDDLDLPDPADRVDELALFQRAGGLLDSAKLEQAETLLRSIVAVNPAHTAASDRLALCLIRQGRHAEAIAPLERVLAGSPGNADTWTYLGACRLVVGEEEKAVAAFTHALELDPNHVQALAGIVNLMESAGLADRAAPLKERFVAVQSRP